MHYYRQVHHIKELGERFAIDTGVGAIFNMTPSPGATCCLGNAEVDMRAVAGFLGARVDEERFATDLLGDDQRHRNSDLPMHIITGEDAA